MKDRIIEIYVLLWIINCFKKVIQNTICLIEDVQQNALVALSRLMIVAVVVEVVTRVKELFYFKLTFFWEADLVLDDSSSLHDDVMVE